ncbi:MULTISPECIES: nuclear transport factor 2 family protein [Streptomyces]|uniref:Nuclear transport factor 2 family protein n=1 Tax=Streptomyces caniscabiei TaxID=2746961 RepID=A0ABU4MT26_9ACTN|nr:nuclear transport factor 2 family protein [Streptomyces caniscabiei]MBE4737600.1 nuclear transport factor 2 family protein [Streptomyces caniscabiei]MBE4756360.1 nuclear transport factor 2 family protein [Streptomyces caniscabiei]MBE4769624.1 nuclear transport factor 2 family protein [Streptomyces caniscabiei]MBE4787431.1 nuclear transport factor 2 family protein [Streptomyces caniscabiei]MBE4795164.1 nuclear transport factor 2 family protein [Streptomyces caniscabiei]
MTQTTATVVDRYITLVDRAVHEPQALQELGSVFAPGAVVRFGDVPPVTGLADITEFYRRFYSDMADCKHVWTTTALDERTLEVRFIAAWRMLDGQLASQGGTEHVTVDDSGLITNLRVLGPETQEAG